MLYSILRGDVTVICIFFYKFVRPRRHASSQLTNNFFEKLSLEMKHGTFNMILKTDYKVCNGNG